MLIEIISKYLDEHRRLIIPSVGAFMVKESERRILFSELLKNDDGVLRSLLRERGLSDIEVAAAVDRFIFELRHATEGVGAEFTMEGFGSLLREDNGRLTFVPMSKPTPEPTPEPIVEPAPTPEAVQEPHQEMVDGGRYSAAKIKELYSKPQTFREKDPEVEDLAYGKKQKPLNGYTFANAEKKRRKGGVDKVLLFGIVAAVVALGVIAYGYYVGHVDEVNDLLVRFGLRK